MMKSKLKLRKPKAAGPTNPNRNQARRITRKAKARVKAKDDKSAYFQSEIFHIIMKQSE